MADSGQPRKRRGNLKFARRKLLKGQKVEIRSIEDGLLGSWHAGKIVRSGSGFRTVRYDHLLCDDESDHILENVEVSSIIDGDCSSTGMSNNFRGRIRPYPLVEELAKETICYGLCVDAYYNDAWWEGVIFDHEGGLDNRKVFFPDLGDELNVEITNLRRMCEWDEVTEEWDPRGKWLFLEILEEHRMENLIPVSIKQIWFELRQRTEFGEIGDWASPVKPLWKKLVVEIVNDHLNLTFDEFLMSNDFSEAMKHGESIGSHDSSLTMKANSTDGKDVVGCSFQDGGLVTKNEECLMVHDRSLANNSLAVDSVDISPSFQEVVPNIGPVVPPQPQALSVVGCHSKGLIEHDISSDSEGPCSDFEGLSSKRRSRKDHNNDENSDFEGGLSSKRKSRKNHNNDETSRKPRRRWTWAPENGELKLKAELCPESIDEYLLSKQPSNCVTKNVRNHIFSLGWTIDCTKYKGQQLRIRYSSPRGQRFYNLRQLCEYIKCEGLNSSSTVGSSQKKKSSSSDSENSSLCKKPHTSAVQTSKRKGKGASGASKTRLLHIEPEYCPEVVERYLECMGRIYYSDSDMSHDELRHKVRKHMSAIGWTFRFRVKNGAIGWFYDSPSTDKVYVSLKSACKAIAEEEKYNTSIRSSPHPAKVVKCTKESKNDSNDELSLFFAGPQQKAFPQRSKLCNILRKPKAEGFRTLHKKKKKKNGLVHYASLVHIKGQDELLDYDGFTNGLKNRGKRCSIKKLSTSFISKKRKALSKVRKCSDGNKMARVLRSSKRIRDAGPSNLSEIPRTIVSWLIDNNVISARNKVYYRHKRDLPSIAEGKITRAGICCSCCKVVFTLSAFEAHAGGSCCQPTENLYLEDGRSLVECQMEMVRKNFGSLSEESLERTRGDKCPSWNDHICSVCQYGGELILCDMCPSSFHKDCLGLQKIPDGDWFCPSCCCGICGESQFNVNSDVNSEEVKNKSILFCHQCERHYHAHCVTDREMVKLDVQPTEKWFCSKTCEKVHWGLQQLLGKPIQVGHNNLTWTVIKPIEREVRKHDDSDIVPMVESMSKLHVALEVMHECFEPVKETHTKRDLIEDVIFCRSSHLNRLNFRGFYNVLLERDDEVITVATLRVHGNKVAEIPLIGTRFKYRRLGMCRIVMNEIEKNLLELGVDRLVLPAAENVLNTWTTSFGFSPVTRSEIFEFLGCTFFDFQDTVLCQKHLKNHPLPLSHLLDKPDDHKTCQNIKGSNSVLDFEGNSGISEEVQPEQVERSESVDQGAQVIGTEDRRNDECGLDRIVPMVSAEHSTNVQNEPCSTEELSVYNCNNTETSIPPAKYPKVEVSCR